MDIKDLKDLPCEHCAVYPALLLKLLAEKLELTKEQIERYQKMVSLVKDGNNPCCKGCPYYCSWDEVKIGLEALKKNSEELEKKVKTANTY
jgi:predicted aconitase